MSSTPKLGPVPCQGCGAPVFWVGRYKLTRNWKEAGQRKGHHVCPGRTCGAWMPHAKDRCARASGHGGSKGYPDHRTRYALDNALYMATGRRVA